MTTPTREVLPRARTRGIPIWLPTVVVALAPLGVLRLKLSAVRDPDALWHILDGEYVWRTHDVVGPDFLGTFTTNVWVHHEWLGEVVMGRIYHFFGLPGVAWLAAAGAVLTYAVLYRSARTRSGILVAGVTACVAWLGTSASLSTRPQTISIILLAVTGVAWQRTSHGPARAPWWLIPLTWLWACCHGLWITGPILGLALVTGLVLDRTVDVRRAIRLGLVPVLSVVAGGLTPIGPRLLRTPFDVSGTASLVTEWAPADIRQPFVAATVALLVVVVVGWAGSRGVTPWFDVAIWVMALGWVLLYSRTVAYGAVLVSPLAAEQIQRLLRRDPDRGTRTEQVVISTGVALALVLGAVVAPHVASEPAGVPAEMTSSLSSLPRGTVVFNDDVLGGWLYWTQPGLRPVIDTRTENYGYAYVSGYIQARAASPGWQAFVDHTGASVALLRQGAALGQALQDDRGWVVLRSDPQFVLLQAP